MIMEAGRKLETAGQRERRQKWLPLLVLALMLLFVLQACQNRPEEEESDLGTSLTAISITPANPTLSDPTTQQLTATGTFADGSTADITDSVNWVSEYPTIATVGDDSDKGLLKTVLTGTTTITARSGTVTGTTTVTVTSAELETIEVTPAHESFATDVTPWVQMKATGIFSDNTVVDITDYTTWSSGTTTVATVSNVSGTRGRATRASLSADGATTITASFKGVSGSTTLTLDDSFAVSGNIQVTPFLSTLINEAGLQFAATVILDDGSSKMTQDITPHVVWTSDDTTRATISNAEDTAGFASADATNTGTPNISCDLGGNASTSSALTVLDTYYLYRLQINPQYRAIAPGIPYQLKAMGIFKQTGASVYFSRDLTDQVSWSSSNTDLVTISNVDGSRGLATLTKIPGAAERTATITIRSPLLSGLTGTTSLTVQSNSFELTSIEVSPAAPTLHINTEKTFKAYGTFSDGTDSYIQDISDTVIWRSSDTSIAVISNGNDTAGKTTLRADGETTITATHSDVSGSTTLTVMPSSYAITGVTVTPSGPTMGYGTFLQMTATASFSNGSDSFSQDVTESAVWSSGAFGNANVSNEEEREGIVTGISSATTAVITAELDGTSGNSTVSVVALSGISAITVTKASNVSSDGTYQLTATADYSGSTQNVTESGTWTTSRPEVASVSNVPGSKGKLRYNDNGTTTITFQLDDESATLDVTVDQQSN